MSVKRQQGSGDQLDLFDEALKAALRHGAAGDGGTRDLVRARSRKRPRRGNRNEP